MPSQYSQVIVTVTVELYVEPVRRREENMLRPDIVYKSSVNKDLLCKCGPREQILLLLYFIKMHEAGRLDQISETAAGVVVQ